MKLNNLTDFSRMPLLSALLCLLLSACSSSTPTVRESDSSGDPAVTTSETGATTNNEQTSAVSTPTDESSVDAADSDSEANDDNDASDGQISQGSEVTPTGDVSEFQNTSNSDQPNILITTSKPEQLMTPASSLLGDIRVVAVLDNGETHEMICCNADAQWEVEIPVSGSGRYTVSVVWQEVYLQQNLNLLAATQTLVVPRGTATISLSQTAYGLNGDIDSDNTLNLTERLQGTNPFDSNDSLLVNIPPGVDILINRFPPGEEPQIDGSFFSDGETLNSLGSEWQYATFNSRDGNPLTISHLLVDQGNQSVLDQQVHRWAAGHDGTYLYLLVLSDDAGKQISDSDSPGRLWKDDDLELYIDGDNSRFTTYDGVNDFNFNINLTQRLSSIPNSSFETENRIVAGPNSAPLPDVPADISFVTGLRTGPSSLFEDRGATDVYEVRIRLATMGIPVERTFGLDLHLNDDDDGGERDHKWSWSHPPNDDSDVDTTWINPSFMGSGWLLN